MKTELHATPEEVMRGVEALQEFARQQGVPERAIFGLAQVLEWVEDRNERHVHAGFDEKVGGAGAVRAMPAPKQT